MEMYKNDPNGNPRDKISNTETKNTLYVMD